MRDKTHGEFIEQWANYVLTHNDWKKMQGEFIDAQYEMAEKAVKRILRQKGGRETIIELYGIKNVKAYKKLLGEND